MVKQQISNLRSRVRFSYPAPEFAVKNFGPCGSVVEHSLGKGEVGSSILPMGTMFGFINYVFRVWFKS